MILTITLLILGVALTVVSLVRPGRKIGVLMFTVGTAALASALLGPEGVSSDEQIIMAVCTLPELFFGVLGMLGWGEEVKE